VIGLSLQETLGNLFAGISMRLDPAFEVGDWIEVSGNLRGGPGRETFIGEVPEYAVLVPGNLPGRPLKNGQPGPSTACAVIVKRVDERTRSKTSINELLRD
jgi:2,3,4,5-tetrahydropyridine-2-carboxylate N-succinyltransferase